MLVCSRILYALERSCSCKPSLWDLLFMLDYCLLNLLILTDEHRERNVNETLTSRSQFCREELSQRALAPKFSVKIPTCAVREQNTARCQHLQHSWGCLSSLGGVMCSFNHTWHLHGANMPETYALQGSGISALPPFFPWYATPVMFSRVAAALLPRHACW